MGRLKQKAPLGAAQLGEELSHLQNGAVELSNEVRRMSHKLHPTELELLGLIPALRVFCAEFSEHEDIKTAFSVRNEPESVAPEVALSVYRIAQEALGNVAKHSGSRKAQVTVLGTGDGLQISVTDGGAGFDVKRAKGKAGLGLISMEERSRSLKGRFSVESKPGKGTKLEVYFPLSSEEREPVEDITGG